MGSATSKHAIPMADCYDRDGIPQDTRILYALPTANVGVICGRFTDDAQRLALELAGLHALPAQVAVCLCLSPDNSGKMYRIADMFLKQGAVLISDRCGAKDRAFPNYEERPPKALKMVVDPWKMLLWTGKVPEDLTPYVVDRYISDLFNVEFVEKVKQNVSASHADMVSKPMMRLKRSTLIKTLSYGRLSQPACPKKASSIAQECAVDILADEVQEKALEPYKAELEKIRAVSAIWSDYAIHAMKETNGANQYVRMFSSTKNLKMAGDELGVDCAVDAYLSGAELEHVLLS